MEKQSLYQQQSFTAVPTGILQRKCAACDTRTIAGGKCEDCENKRGVPPVVNEVLNSPGKPLDKDTRGFFESRFEHNFSSVPVSSSPQRKSQNGLTIGESKNVYEQEADRVANSVITNEGQDKGQGANVDLSRVRVHTDSKAAESAASVNALAYTVGNNIVFGAGQFAPGTQAGQRLIAHELTHVAQQSAGRGEGLVMRDEPKDKPKPVAPKPAVPKPAAPPPKKIDFTEEDEPKQAEPKDKAPAGQQTGAPAATGAKDEHSLFFQDPKIAGDPKQSERNRIYVESELTKVGTNINIRYAYPLSEMSKVEEDKISPSQTVTDVKLQIGKLIAEVIADIGTFPPPKDKADEQRILQERARLGEAFRDLTTTKPLNIFIATLPNQSEMVSGQFVPTTDTVYIDAKDVGNKSKLEAAVRIPLQNLKGGISPRTGKKESAVSPAELKDAVLHEALHAMLIRKGIGSDAQWEKLKSGKFKINGPSDAQAKGEEIVRKFLIAQDEVFVYESVATLYKPSEGDKLKESFDSFIKNAKSFLIRKGAKMSTAKYSVSVSEKVDKKAVPWNITYELPDSLTLTAEDSKVIDVILIGYPNN
jgi:Domain of unknown function (DUF4157)